MTSDQIASEMQKFNELLKRVNKGELTYSHEELKIIILMEITYQLAVMNEMAAKKP